MDKIDTLIASPKSVFTVQDLAVLWSLPKGRRLYESIKYYVRTKRLISLRRGLYALPANIRPYSPFELAQKLIPLSYISLSTALVQHGIRFQFQSSIQSMAIISKTITVKNQKYEYHQIKEDVLLNSTGLIKNDQNTVAGPERAVCDTLYLFPSAAFDNLRPVDTTKLVAVSQIYNNTSLEKRVHNLLKVIGD